MTGKKVKGASRSNALGPREANGYRKALVIGGGIAGIQTALDIANSGFPVILVEKRPSIGGHVAQLSQIFPTMTPTIDMLAPLMSEVDKHPNIKLLTLSEVVDLNGHQGRFHVHIKKNPRFVNPEKCNPDKCDKCTDVCPVTVPSEFDEGLTLRKAIYIPFPQAVPSTYSIDESSCILCGKCAQPDACSPRAVNLADEEEIVEEDVGAIVISTGYELCNQETAKERGMEECTDVITALQFERLLSLNGPTAGSPKRPSDGETPKKIALIPCTGLDEGKPRPSYTRIRDAYFAKQAILYKRAVPFGTVFDLSGRATTRGQGKGHLLKRAEEAAVNYIPTEVSGFHNHNGKVRIHGTQSPQRKKIEIDVDLAIVALPMRSSPALESLIGKLRVRGAQYRRLKTSTKTPPLESPLLGVFKVGCAQTPMDIHNTVAQAHEAADQALSVLKQIKRVNE